MKRKARNSSATKTILSIRVRIFLALLFVSSALILAGLVVNNYKTLKLLSIPQKVAVQSFSVPVTVEELLPSGVTGTNRNNQIVTFGIPLKDEYAVTNVSQLGLSGVTVGQFKETRRWPKSGNLQWVTVDTEATVAAGSFTNIALTNGSGNFDNDGNPANNTMAMVSAGKIAVNTGVAQFDIKKSNFNVIDSAIVNGQSFITAGHSGGLWLLDNNGTTFSSIYDPAPQVTVEQDGPAHTIVKAIGTLTSVDRLNHNLYYTLRLHFFRNSAQIKMDLALRNANSSDLSKKAFRSLGLRLPTNLTGAPQFLFPTNVGNFSGALSTGTAYLFQAYSKNKIDGDYGDVIAPTVGTQTGMEIKNGPSVSHSLGSDLEWSLGWARLSESTGQNRAITIAQNHLSEFWGGGFEFSPDGNLDLQIFSPHNSYQPIYFTWGARDSRQIMIDFHNTVPVASDNSAFLALANPLFGRATDYHYYEAGSILGAKHLVDETEFSQFISATDSAFGQSVTCRPLRDSLLANENKDVVWRARSWGKTGGNNQLDKSVSYFLDYLRTGKGGLFLRAYHDSRFKADQAAVRCDDCDLLATWPNSNPNAWNWGDYVGGYNGGGISGNTLESNRNHSHWQSILVAWLLTGENEFYNDTREIADYIALRENGEYGARNRIISTYGFGSGGLRGWPNSYRDHALFAEYLNLPREWQYLRFMTDQLISSRDGGGCSNGTKYDGRNMDRGFLYSQSHMDCPYGRGNSFYHQYFVPFGTWEAARVLRDLGTDAADPGRVEELSDFLLGQTEFEPTEITKYSRVPGNGSFDGWRTPYRISYQYPNPVTSSSPSVTEEFKRADYLPAAYGWAYQQTGNAIFLEVGQGMFCRMMQYEPYERGSDIAAQDFIWTWLNRNKLGGGFITPQKQSLGGNNWQLQWTAPANTESYMIKSAAKPLVENLYFDEQRVDNNDLYLYPPSSNQVYWAANDLSGEPAPLPGGSNQTANVTVPSGDNNFLIRYSINAGAAVIDTTPPQISSIVPAASVVAGTSTRFGLSTNEAATCKYSLSAGQSYPLMPYYLPITGKNIHRSRSVASFSPGTYSYYVRCKDVAGNINSADTLISFTITPGAGDIIPPQISGVSAGSISQQSAVISWTTNEPATSIIEYGLTASYGFSTTLDTNFVLNHSQTLSALQANTTYHYRVRSKDASNNEAVSGDYTFTTATAPIDIIAPVISNVLTSNLTTNSADIIWDTNEAANSQIEYGLTVSYGQNTVLDPSLVLNHSQSISGLTASSFYHYRVRSADAGGNIAWSADNSFTTTAQTPGGIGWLQKFDFNMNSDAANQSSGDWTNLIHSVNSIYSEVQGYGFDLPSMYGVSGRTRALGDVMTKDYMNRGSSLSATDPRNSPTFKIKVPANGNYMVVVHRGDTEYPNNFAQPMKVEESGVLIGTVAAQSTAGTAPYPIISSDQMPVMVSDGYLNLRFTMDGICTPSGTCSWGLNGLEVYQVVNQCGDRTNLNSCSSVKPRYCDASGNLSNNCSLCGCPSGQQCISATGLCQNIPAPKKNWLLELLGF
ncbi:MAG: hypothetical protein C3F02_02440 [Parcubacteria group bacterium]|nr:MAG: hypothetical protein C3F02_02440 [Parcubacteria group bacterium]